MRGMWNLWKCQRQPWNCLRLSLLCFALYISGSKKHHGLWQSKCLRLLALAKKKRRAVGTLGTVSWNSGRSSTFAFQNSKLSLWSWLLGWHWSRSQASLIPRWSGSRQQWTRSRHTLLSTEFSFFQWPCGWCCWISWSSSLPWSALTFGARCRPCTQPSQSARKLRGSFYWQKEPWRLCPQSLQDLG